MSEVFTDDLSTNKVHWIGFFIGIFVFAMCLFVGPLGGMSQKAWLTLAMTALMAIWWATEAIPIPATSLLPVILVPLLGIDTISKATAPFANSVVFLFLGGFVIGLALERWNLHKRVALMTLIAVGNNPKAQIAGFMGVTAFISMWVSNTATAIMMLPIGLSVISMLSEEKSGDDSNARFAIALLLGIAYSASVGGIGTLIGTPPNALLAGFLNETYGFTLTFAKWMIIGVPVSILMLIITWWWLTRKGFNVSSENSHELFKKELEKLGKFSRAEKMVGVIFLLTSFAWIFQPLLKLLIPALNDTIIAIIAALLLFSIPVDVKNRVFLMDWKSAKKIPWDVLLLFGGGLSMAAAIQSSGLSVWIATSAGSLVGGLPVIVMILIVVGIIQFLTELTSNTATAATFLPLMAALAIAQSMSPIMLAIPTVIAASCAFMMPVGTPPNAIIFGSGKVPIASMIKNGFFLTITGTILITIICYFLIPLIWDV
ncbi:MAG: SLC13 family permease [Campylobacteraceae bacterium]